MYNTFTYLPNFSQYENNTCSARYAIATCHRIDSTAQDITASLESLVLKTHACLVSTDKHHGETLDGGQHPRETDKCAICNRKTKLLLDHCHKSGTFRGFLCTPCNTGIALLGDNKEGVERALRYLSMEQ